MWLKTKNVSVLLYKNLLNQAFFMTHTFDSEVSLHSWLLWPTVRFGRYVAVCVAFIRNHDAFDRLTHYFLSPLQLEKSFVAIVGTWQLYLQWHKYGAPNMALKYEWGFYPRWNYILHTFKDGKDQWASNVIKFWEIAGIAVSICFYLHIIILTFLILWGW